MLPLSRSSISPRTTCAEALDASDGDPADHDYSCNLLKFPGELYCVGGGFNQSVVVDGKGAGVLYHKVFHKVCKVSRK